VNELTVWGLWGSRLVRPTGTRARLLVVVEAAIPFAVPDLEATFAVQAAVIAELRAANAEQARLIATLQARLAELERRLGKGSSNSSKPPSSDRLGKPARAERRVDEPTKQRRPGKQPGAPGAHLAQVECPDEVVWHVPDRCDGCGADLVDASVVGVEALQVFDLPPLRLLASEHRAERRRCGCGTTTAAAFPNHVRAAACYGPGVRALVCYLCVHQHLPVDRAAQLMGDVLGAPLATGTLAAVLTEARPGCPGLRGWRCMTAGRRTGGMRTSAMRCAARTCCANSTVSPTSRGRPGRPAWPSWWPMSSWPGSTAIVTRCCGRWTTAAWPSTTTRPNATCAW
jgi:transposase/uncharacterized coiled-coil protein SlyX